MPLKTREGHNLGNFVIIDKKPRTLTEEKKEIFKELASLVMNQMDLRLDTRLAVKNQHNLMNITAHDLKNPLSIMPLLADMILMNKNEPDAIEKASVQIREAGRRMTETITHLLETTREEAGKNQLRLKKVDFDVLVKGVVLSNNVLAHKKKQKIGVVVEKCVVFADHQRLTEIIDNLINNAIKYSPLGKRIHVTLKRKKDEAYFEVKDEGPGLTKDDMKNLFRRFTSLSAQPTGGENSTGLGLSIVKDLVDAHNGKIFVNSEGKGKGASFAVVLPLSEGQ